MLDGRMCRVDTRLTRRYPFKRANRKGGRNESCGLLRVQETSVVEELDIDKPKKGEVKVRMAATAVCHSDIHFIMGEMGGGVPFVPGHESSGYIDELGEG